jgi:hypothetical protein
LLRIPPSQETFTDFKKKPAKAEGEYKDPAFYMSHYQSSAEHDTKGCVPSCQRPDALCRLRLTCGPPSFTLR